MNLAGYTGPDIDFGPSEGNLRVKNGIVQQYDYIDIDDYHEKLAWLNLCPVADFGWLYPELELSH